MRDFSRLRRREATQPMLAVNRKKKGVIPGKKIDLTPPTPRFEYEMFDNPKSVLLQRHGREIFKLLPIEQPRNPLRITTFAY
jgi:hypothetical protein